MNDINLERNRKYWDEQAASKRVNWHIAHASENDNEFYKTAKKDITALFFNNLNYIPPNAIVLDFGCGKGRLVKYVHEKRQDCKIIGIDISHIMIEHCYRILSSLQNVFFITYDGGTLESFIDNTFDVIYSSYVLQHLPRNLSVKIVREFYRILKNNGILCLQLQYSQEPQLIDPDDDDFRSIRYYTKHECEMLFTPNLNSTKQQYGIIIERQLYVPNSKNAYFIIRKKDIKSL